MRRTLIRDLASYICEPSDQLKQFFHKRHRSDVDTIFDTECTHELWIWLNEEICFDSLDFKPWRRFMTHEVYSVRQNPYTPEPTYFLAKERGKTVLCQYHHAPYTMGYEVLTTLLSGHDPGQGGHIAPYYSEYGPSIIVFGGELNKVVWIYVPSVASWFRLADAPRNIQYAGIQVITAYKLTVEDRTGP